MALAIDFNTSFAQGCQMVRISLNCHDFRSLSSQVSGQEKMIKMSGFLAKEKWTKFWHWNLLKTMKRNTQNSMYKHRVQHDIAWNGNSIRYKLFVAKLHSKRLNRFTYSMHCMLYGVICKVVVYCKQIVIRLDYVLVWLFLIIQFNFNFN